MDNELTGNTDQAEVHHSVCDVFPCVLIRAQPKLSSAAVTKMEIMTLSGLSK